MVDVNPYQIPHRKPVGGLGQGHQPTPAGNNVNNRTPPNSIPPFRQPAVPSHTHSRTVSSNVFPAPNYSQQHQQQQNTYTQIVGQNRRSASTATNSTMSSQGGPPSRTPSAVSISLRRSTSSRSGQSVTPTSYVALMRKQKATVWCDRSQHEDPRLAAQAKQAKMRATLEVVGGLHPRNSTSTGGGGSSLGMRSKITSRHHGATKAVGYSGVNLLGTSGVPMRLSASEVGDEGESEATGDAHSMEFRGQGRSGSGRSSARNSGRLSAINQGQARSSPQGQVGRLSTGSTPPGGSPGEGGEEGGGLEGETPIAGTFGSKTMTMTTDATAVGEDYFQHPPGDGGSGSSGESESRFGGVSDMQAPKAANEGKGADDLMRRGSVDERATTMRSHVRLFVANPDLSD